MNNFEEVVGVKTYYENSTNTELETYLYSMKNKWVLENNKNPLTLISTAMDNFGLTENYDFETLEQNYNRCLYNVYRLQEVISKQMYEEDDYLDEDHDVIFNKIFESIHYLHKILQMSCILVNSHSDEHIQTNIGMNGQLLYIKPNYEINSPLQNLILYLLDEIYLAKLQRYGESLYQKIYYNGHFTHAWKEKMTIRQFIYEKTEYCVDYQQWHNLTSNPSNIKNATDFLENCKDPRINNLVKDRHVFAFTNGIYSCKEVCPETGMYVDHFYEYGSDVTRSMDMSRVASKFFKCDFNNFDEVDDWYHIETPNFQSILDYQEFEEDVARWVYVFVGRLFFDLGELDNWQVALFLEGIAGSGKSTITKLVKKFYETADIGVLSNNIEKTFGLGALKDKLLILAPEIKGDFKLEQSEFQLLIEGGDMQLPIKHKNSHYLEWKSPALFAGNEPPNYTDNSGSISRRLVVAKFSKKVTNVDSDLESKLTIELPTLIKKCASAYLSAVNTYRGQDFWSSLPKYFRDTRQDMAQNTHALEHFICSGKVNIGENYYVREKTFIDAFNDHCKQCNLDKHKFTSDYSAGVFSNHGLKRVTNQKLKYPNNDGGVYYTGAWILGVDVIDEFSNDGDNEI